MMSALPVLSLLVVVVFSLIVVRVASIALALTGVSEQLARFQARSAFTGAGFTTSESEKMMQHPVRRQIIMLLMLLGNAGFITAISTLILSFLRTGSSTGVFATLWFRMALLAAGLSALWWLAHSQFVDHHLSRIITAVLKRWTDLEVRDYSELLHLSGDYAVAELVVEQDDWLASRRLTDLQLNSEGVLVLGVEKPGGSYLGAPRGDYRFEPDDNVLLYGPRDVLAGLDERRAGREGNWEHHVAVEKQVKTRQGQKPGASAAANAT